MSIQKRVFMSFGMIFIILLAFGIYMSTLYATLENRMHDGNVISNIVLKLQEARNMQTEFIKSGNIEDATDCTVILDDLNVNLNDPELYITLDALLEIYNTQFSQLKAVKENLTISEYHSLVLIDTITSSFYENPLSSEHTLSPHIALDELKTQLVKLLTVERYYFIDKDNASELLLHTKKLKTMAYEMMNSTTNDEIKAFSKTLYENTNTLYEIYDDIIVLSESTDTVIAELENTMTSLIQTAEGTREVYRESNQEIIARIKSVYIIMYLLTLSISGYFVLKLLNHIKSALNILLNGTENIAKGNYDFNMAIPGNDEFTTLSRGIAHMARELQSAHFSIITYNTQLKKMVEAKTFELQSAKDELEKLNASLTLEKEKYVTLAMTDPLTGIKNRAYLMTYLNQLISEAKRYEVIFSIMLLDIDFFKHVNDKYGHNTGDEVLKSLSNILKDTCRQSDVIARYGGEEFIIIFAKTRLHPAITIAERIRKTIENTPMTEHQINITISAGVTTYRLDTIESLIKRVDSLQYDAKRDGKNCIKSDFDPLV